MGGGEGICQRDARCLWGALVRLPWGHWKSWSLKEVGRKVEGRQTIGEEDPGCETEGGVVRGSRGGRQEGAQVLGQSPGDMWSED